jgi:hypothetical protein
MYSVIKPLANQVYHIHLDAMLHTYIRGLVLVLGLAWLRVAYGAKTPFLDQDYLERMKTNKIDVRSSHCDEYRTTDDVDAAQKQSRDSYPRQHGVCMMTKFRIRTTTTLCNFIEWIEYHILLGVDHFYVLEHCNNDEREKAFKVLKYYEERGLLTYFIAVDDLSQCDKKYESYEAMNDIFLDHAYQDCEFLGYLDYDEFITLRNPMHGVPLNQQFDNYLNTTPPHPLHGSITLERINIGNEQHVDRPKGFTIENYQNIPIKKGTEFLFAKSFARTRDVNCWWSCHFPAMRPDFFQMPNYTNDDIEILHKYGEDSRSGFTPSYHWNKHLHEGLFVEVQHSNTVENDPSETHGVWVPTQNVFIKHYMYLSFEEYMMTRGSFTSTPEGFQNKWSNDPWQKWQDGNTSIGTGFRIAHDFTALMAIHLREKVSATFEPNQLPYCRKIWGLQ